MNSLTVLGGSAAGVGTGQGCSSYLVQTDSTRIVLDMGMNTLYELRKHVDFRELSAIVISHLHMDHVLDLFALRFMCNYNPVKPDRPIPLVLPPGGLEFMARAAEFWKDPTEDRPYFDCYAMQEYDPNGILTVGDLELTFAPTAHPVPCWAIRVHPTDGSDDLVYTADSGSDGDLDGICRDAAVIVVDGAAAMDADPEKVRGLHYTPAQAAELCARANTRHMVLSHLWEENDPLKSMESARSVFTGRLSLATPGLTITW